MENTANAAQLLGEKELFVFDMDGTIYLEDRVFPFAVRFIRHLRAHGKRVLFFTNNASRASDFYMERLTRMGFAPARDEIMSSGDVTAAYLLHHRRGKSVYLLGTESLRAQFAAQRIPLVPEAAEQADIVVSSFDTELTYRKLTCACTAVRNGAEYFCTHPDYNCPTVGGFLPDSGAIAALITASTGVKPTFFGKPYAQTVQMITAITQTPRDRMCFFGDRLYTDIAVGVRHGVCAVLVLTGETTAEMAESAAKDCRPDLIFPSLAEADRCMFGTAPGE